MHFKRDICALLCALLLPMALLACGGSPADNFPLSSDISPSSLSSEIARSPSPAPSPTPSPSPAPSPSAEPSPLPAVEAMAPVFDPELAIAAAAGPGEKIFLLSPADVSPEDPGFGAKILAAPTAELPQEKTISAFETADPMWYAVLLEDGTAGYAYGNGLCRVGEDGAAAKLSLVQEYINEKLAALEAQFPDGKYWNHMGVNMRPGSETPLIVTNHPCDHGQYGELYCNTYNGGLAALFPADTLSQCMGFASYLSDQIFGENAPFHVFEDPELLQVGDHIRLLEYEHSMTVTEITAQKIAVAEVNENYEDCLIAWTRSYTRSEFSDLAWDMMFISRYPLCPDKKGGFMPWPPGTEP